MVRNIQKLVLLSFIVTLSVTAYGQVNFFENLDNGTYAVGYRKAEINNLEGSDRKVQISFWYPAKNSGARKLTLAEYLSTDDQLLSDLAKILSVKVGGEENLFPQDSLVMLLQSNTLASLNASEVEEKFPVVMWSGRNETIEYQWLISEYLASNGYIVAYVEDVPSGRFPWQLPTLEEKETALNQQVSNMSDALRYLWQNNNGDSTKNGIISWSYAGESAILSQIGNPSFRSVVGLSSLGFSAGVFLGSELESRIDIKKMDVPYLMLFEKIAPNGNERTIPAIFPSMNPDSRYVSFPELAHGSFNTLEGMIPGILSTNKVQRWSRGGDVAKVGFETVSQLALAFLDATLKNKGDFDEAVSKAQNKTTEGFVTSSSPKY